MSAIRKHSRKREAILEKIRGTTTHPSAVWVYEELRREIPDLSLGTVYRNISVFKDEGLITSVGVVAGQERFDGDISEHTHFICLECGCVLDVGAALDSELTARVETENGVDITCRQLTFYGRCAECKSRPHSALTDKSN